MCKSIVKLLNLIYANIYHGRDKAQWSAVLIVRPFVRTMYTWMYIVTSSPSQLRWTVNDTLTFKIQIQWKFRLQLWNIYTFVVFAIKCPPRQTEGPIDVTAPPREEQCSRKTRGGIPSRRLQFTSMNEIARLVARLNSAVIAQSGRCSWISGANNPPRASRQSRRVRSAV